MSYQYAQYGEGYEVVRPSPEALSFAELVELKGVDITIIERNQTAYDDYNQPVYTETRYTDRAFIEVEPREEIRQPGAHKETQITGYLQLWSPIGPRGFDLESSGDRYRITSYEATSIFIKVEAVRMHQ